MGALTSFLLRDSVVGVDDIEDAIQRQVNAGGTMDTALLELDLVAENTLAAYWAASHGLPPIARDMLQSVPLTVLQRVPRRLADAHRMVPTKFVGGLLDIVFASAPPVAVLDHLAVKLEVEVSPRIGLHIAVVDALHRYYGVEISRREAALLGTLDQRDAGVLVQVNEPTSEEERRVRLRTPRYGFQLSPGADAPTMRRAGSTARGFGAPFIEAQQKLARADDADQIMDVLLEFVDPHYDYVAVFASHRDVARGRRAVGSGADVEAVRAMAVPLELPSAFARARGTLIPVRFSPDEELDVVVAEDLGVPTLEEAWVVPISRDGHVTLLVVAVGGPLGGDEGALHPLSAIAPAVAKALGRQPIQRPSLPPFAYESSAGGIEAARRGHRPTALGLPASPFDPRLFPEPMAWPISEASIIPDYTTLIPPSLFEEVVLSSPALPSDDYASAGLSITPDRQSATEPPPADQSSDDGLQHLPDLDRLVTALADSDPGEADALIEELLPHEEVALAVLKEQFPGRLWWDRHRTSGVFPHAEEVSAIGRCLIRIGPRGFRVLSPHLESGTAEVRLAALSVAAELLDEELMPHLCRRVFDVDEEVRAVALDLLARRSHHGASWQAMLSGLRAAARVPRPDSAVRFVSVKALGELRDPQSLTLLIDLVGDPDADIAAAAKEALTVITGQDLGLSTRRWWQWADANRWRHRVEWLIDALCERREAMREVAARELEQLTEHYVGYHPALAPSEREACQERYRDWWRREGEARFAPAGSTAS